MDKATDTETVIMASTETDKTTDMETAMEKV